MEIKDVKEIYGALFMMLGVVCILTAGNAGALEPLGWVIGIAMLSGGAVHYFK